MGRSGKNQKSKSIQKTRNFVLGGEMSLESVPVLKDATLANQEVIKALLSLKAKAMKIGRTPEDSLETVNLSDEVIKSFNFAGINLSNHDIRNTKFLQCQFNDPGNTEASSIFDFVDFDQVLIDGPSDLSHCSIRNSRFSGSTVQDVSFFKTNFSGSNLTEQGSRFLNCSFSGSNLSFTKLNDGDFSGSKFDGTVFAVRPSFQASLLKSAKFFDIVFDRPDFADTSLEKAVFSGGSFDNGEFDRSNLTEVLFEKVSAENTEFQETVFVDACVSESFFSGANFAGANLENTRFDYTDLSNTDFRGAKLDGVVFRKCNLTGVKLPNDTSRSVFVKCTMPS